MSKNLLGYLLEYNKESICKDFPYNEIDALIFAVFSYAPVGPDIRGFGEEFHINPIGKTMGELSEILIDIEACGLLSMRFGKSQIGEYGQHLRFFMNIAQNKRYRDIEIINFEFDNSGFCQFSAYTFKIGKRDYVVAYRGTDNSLEGWYESYKMFNCDVPGQISALNYLQSEMKKNKGIYRICGHSKGGRLALFAAISCNTEEKIKIRSVINFDGPGFDLEYINKNYKEILSMQHKTYLFAPVDAMVSTMFFGQDILYYENNIRYIKPYGLQIAPIQHLYFNWTLNDSNRFEIAPQSRLSMLFKDKIQELMFLYPPNEIEKIIEDMFTEAQEAKMRKETSTSLSTMEIMRLFINLTFKLSKGKSFALK